MDRLNRPMRELIRNYNAGAVATIDDAGRPAVSPKATFVIVDEGCIAFGDIRSPQTVSNLRQRPGVEVCFIDVLARLALRVRGEAEVLEKDSAGGRALLPHFEALWAPYIEHMRHFVSIAIDRAELVTSPAYDIGLDRAGLVATNFDKLSRLAAARGDSS